MLEKKQVYQCETCNNIVESLWNGNKPISCCRQTMTKLVPNTVDATVEKHVPKIIRDGNVVTVKIGEIAHPMAPKHYILFLEVLAGDKVYRHDFKEGDRVAEASFLIDENAEITARAFCNLHGFWSATA